MCIMVIYVFDFIAHCWATFNARRALLFSHIMTNKDDDDDDNLQIQWILYSSKEQCQSHTAQNTDDDG